MAVIIAGERSGVGKTTITLAILAYLCDGRRPKTAPPNSPTPQLPNSPTPQLPSQTPKHVLSPSNASQALPLVQSFKVGPDYIDPMFHTYVTGRPCRNLDSILTSEDYVRQCFIRHSQEADYSIVEGVMGLFDGASGNDDTASTAHTARLLDIPIVLVLDCGRLSRSIAAIIHGYTTFDPRLNFAGVILNRVGSDRHLQLLKTAIEPLHIPILGVLNRDINITIPDRHLGLIPTDEFPELDNVIHQLSAIATTSLNWDLLLPLLQNRVLRQKAEGGRQKAGGRRQKVEGRRQKAEGRRQKAEGRRQKAEGRRQKAERDLAEASTPQPFNAPTPQPFNAPTPQRPNAPTLQRSNAPTPQLKSKIRIAIARDRAFSFYYPDNFDILEQLGATLVFWSPLSDPELPDDIHGLYLGGGFPEVFASTLAANQTAKASVKAAIEGGVPTYAECGGLMYLCKSIVDLEEKQHPMVGLIPTTARMGKRLTLGYRKAIAQLSTPLMQSGKIIWGHEFHRSHLTTSSPSPLYELYGYKADNDASSSHYHHWEGWSSVNLHASYVHVHWGKQRHIPQRFLTHCRWQQHSKHNDSSYSD
ncbi:MAG: cobyrinate a,c-diamide synthase [Cyanobacteria bacterium P01_F01_bin.150]